MDVELLSPPRDVTLPHLHSVHLLLAPALTALTLHPYTLRASVTPPVDLQDPSTPTIPLARRARCPGPWSHMCATGEIPVSLPSPSLRYA